MSETVEELELNIAQPDSLSAITDDVLRNAVVAYNEKNYSKALNTLLGRYSSDNTGAYANLIGCCYQKIGEEKEAINFWRKAISQNPNCYQAFISLGNIYYIQQNTRQALLHWHIALSISPETPQINYNLATTYSVLDDRLNAVYYYERFLKYCQDGNDSQFKSVHNIILSLRTKASNLLKKASVAIQN